MSTKEIAKRLPPHCKFACAVQWQQFQIWSKKTKAQTLPPILRQAQHKFRGFAQIMYWSDKG
jgi:hypothetical protein